MGISQAFLQKAFNKAAERLDISGAVLELQEIVSLRSALIFLWDWDKYFFGGKK